MRGSKCFQENQQPRRIIFGAFLIIEQGARARESAKFDENRRGVGLLLNAPSARRK